MSNMVVRTNIFALNAHRNMKNVGMDQSRASNRLSSGFRINSAADDAAGLAISENMRAQIRGLDQASRNTQDGQAMLLTTEGGLEEIGNMLQRTRELMVQAANDTNTQDQRGLIQQEIGQLGREIISMQNRVEFNTNRVLAMGPVMTASVVEYSSKMDISAHNQRIVSGALGTAMRNTQAALDLISEIPAGQKVYVGEKGGAAGLALAQAMRGAAEFISNFGELRDGGLLAASPVGDAANYLARVTAMATVGMDATGSFSAGAVTPGISASAGDIRASLLERVGQVSAAMVRMNTGGAQTMRNAFETNHTAIREFVNADSTNNNIAFFQVGANASQGINFDFETVSRAVSSAGWTVSLLAPTMAAPGMGSGIGNGVRISPYISALDSSIDDISRVRANLGAVQNRMDYTMRSLDISSENLQDSESRVRNADIAREMMRFTMSNVLQQAAVSMLAQANQMPQNLLQLLR